MWIEEKNNGKVVFRERYTHPLTGGNIKVSVTFDRNTQRTRKMAQEILNRRIAEKLKELHRPDVNPNRMTLHDLIELYQKDQSMTVSASTCRRNQFATNKLELILGANTRLSALSANYIRDRFNATGEAPGTLNERLTRLKALLRWAYRNDYIDDVRFLDKLKRYPDPVKKEKLEEKFLESDDLKKLIEAMDVEQWRLLTELLAYSGLRVGEALALRIGDIDIPKKYIYVRATLDPVTQEMTDPKTRDSIRDVYMQKNLLDVVKKIQIMHKRNRLHYGFASDLLFCDANGNPVQYYAYNKFLKETAQRVLNRTISTHIMRHTHTALMAEAGVPLEAISRRLGHADSAVTKHVYMHVTERMKQQDNALYERMVL